MCCDEASDLGEGRLVAILRAEGSPIRGYAVAISGFWRRRAHCVSDNPRGFPVLGRVARAELAATERWAKVAARTLGAIGTTMKLTYSLRDWQERALAAWVAAGQRGVVSVVTGGGKTRFAEACIVQFLEDAPDAAVHIVVPTLALVDQWVVGLEEDLGLDKSDVAVYAGGKRPLEGARFSVFTLVSARENVPRLATQKPTMLVVDECHRIGSPVNSLGLDAPFAATLGLSATPERDSDEGFATVIAPALGDIVFSYTYEEARADGVITPFDLVNVRVPMLDEESEAYEKASASIRRLYRRYEQGAVSPEKLAEALRRRARIAAQAQMRVPTCVRILEQHRGARAIVFHEFIDPAEQIAALLEERGISSTIYHSRIGPALRQDNLRLFRRGAFEALVTCRALDEGINVPETEVAVIASGTASRRQRIQRMGRVLRPAKGKSRAMVYTLFASDAEEQRLREEQMGSESGADSVRWMDVRRS